MYNDGVKLIEARGEGDSPHISLWFDKQLRDVFISLISLSFCKQLRRLIVVLICLIMIGGYGHFLGVRSEFKYVHPYHSSGSLNIDSGKPQAEIKY